MLHFMFLFILVYSIVCDGTLYMHGLCAWMGQSVHVVCLCRLHLLFGVDSVFMM